MKPLKFCANGDGNSVCPPSLVIYKECLNKISTNLATMIKNMENKKNETPAK
jgi:hypothetical protein